MTPVLEAAVAADATSVSTSSISPTQGVPYLVCVVTEQSGVPPSVTGTNGWNVTWSAIGGNSGGEVTFPGAAEFRLDWFIGIPSSGTAGVLTAAGDGSNLTTGMHVYRTDADTTGTVVQSEDNTGTTATTATVTLAAFGHADNGTMFSVIWNGINTRTPSAPLGNITTTNVFFGSHQFSTAYHTGNDTAPDITWSSNSDWAALGIEVKAGGGGIGEAQQIPAILQALSGGTIIGRVDA